MNWPGGGPEQRYLDAQVQAGRELALIPVLLLSQPCSGASVQGLLTDMVRALPLVSHGTWSILLFPGYSDNVPRGKRIVAGDVQTALHNHGMSKDKMCSCVWGGHDLGAKVRAGCQASLYLLGFCT